MQAMIFAAGMGTRLKPLTDVIPKALVPVGNKPLLQLVAEKLISSGVDHIVVNVHHKAAQIVNFLSLLRHSYPDITIDISDESTALLETGGGIKKAAHLFLPDEPVLIHNVDILSNINITDLCATIGNADALLLVSERKTQRYLLFNDQMRLVGWTNISTGEVRSPFREIVAHSGYIDIHSFLADTGLSMFAFSGIHIIAPSLIERMGEFPDRFPIMDFYLSLCKDTNIRGTVATDLRLLDVGKLDTLASAEDFLP